MKFIKLFIGISLLLLSCKIEPKKPFNIEQEALNTEAELKASKWIGYNDFVFELKSLTENFSKEYALEKSGNLVSKSQAILYSMPNELRNDTTNEKASKLVQTTKGLYNSIITKSEEEIVDGLKKIVTAYTALNKEINYYTNN